jgi:hypothetical protein
VGQEERMPISKNYTKEQIDVFCIEVLLKFYEQDADKVKAFFRRKKLPIKIGRADVVGVNLSEEDFESACNAFLTREDPSNIFGGDKYLIMTHCDNVYKEEDGAEKWSIFVFAVEKEALRIQN